MIEKMNESVTQQAVWYKAGDERCAEVLPRKLVDFYQLKCPYAKSDESRATSAVAMNLSDKGWEREKLHLLMQWIASKFVNESRLSLSFKVSENVNKTTRELGLDIDSPAVLPCRGVLQINNKAGVSESGECKVKLNEAYATCLFRHIRNSIAHANYMVTESGHVLLLDASSKPNTAAKKRN